MDYSREELIAILERSVVPEDRWSNRDTADAQRQAGEALFLLKAGCAFRIMDGSGPKHSRQLITDAKTIWIEVKIKGFSYFEQGGEDDETFYLPTALRLLEANGGDWY